MATESITPLRSRSVGLLFAASLVFFAIASFSGRSITTHEAVHCENVREMLLDHDWVIPHYGGREWLERPPLPHWATAAVVGLFGDPAAEWTYRLAAALAGALIVAEIGWIASLWFGSGIGLLSGAIFATTRTGFAYATGSECDIFLAAVVTTAVTLVVRLEFALPKPVKAETFLGGRRWEVPAFFLMLGLTNTAKGLFFGMSLGIMSVAGFLLGRWSWESLRRYVWLWGWLIFIAAAVAWPFAAMVRVPGVTELWESDYLGRLNSGFLREPAWYYLAALPWCLFPWSITAVLGFVDVARGARDSQSPQRFLLAWAVLPIAFLTIPQGKHHHYLLAVLAPWCILSAVASEKAWRWLCSFPVWVKHPITSAALALAACGASVVIFRGRIEASDAQLIALSFLASGFAAVFRWALNRPQPRLAAMWTCGLIGLGCLVFEGVSAAIGDSYRADRVFVAQVEARVPQNETVLVVNDGDDPLDASWMLFYLQSRSHLLHNLSYLWDESITNPDVWVVGRGLKMQELPKYGRIEEVARSEFSRSLKRNPQECWTLYRVHLPADRPRISTRDVPISPLQATGRARGPLLTPVPAFAQAP